MALAALVHLDLFFCAMESGQLKKAKAFQGCREYE